METYLSILYQPVFWAVAFGFLTFLWLIYKGAVELKIFGSSFPVLSKYSKNLTNLARHKKLDPVIGRHKEIARVIQILTRRTKNNPVLIGKAGVGKTAIAEGLALAIVARQVPETLYKKKVLLLDLSAILAGTKYRGEFEQRLKKITDEILAAGRTIILFIDEIHILAETGGAEGAINAADILKPLLARGELQVIGATTPNEYKEYIRNDKTLDRRLQPVKIGEPTAKETEAIIAGIKKIYENYHKVIVSDGAVKASVIQTKKMPRAYPDKAIDALDEACSQARIDANTLEKAKRWWQKVSKQKKHWPEIKAKDIKIVVDNWQKEI